MAIQSGSVFQDIGFAARAEEVFDVLADGDRHAQMTGAPAQSEPRPGAPFSAYDGRVTGTVVEASRPHRLVLDWRGADWPEGHFSKLRFDLEPTAEGRRTLLHLTHENIPLDHLEVVSRGWWGFYWSKMTEYFIEQRKAVVEHFVQEYKNRGNHDIVDELVTHDCGLHIPIPGLPEGREGMRTNGHIVGGAFPDVKVRRAFWVVEGDIVVERAIAEATHKGELMGIPPTGNKVSWTELHAYRVDNGRIAEVWSEADLLGVMGQIGALPPPES